MQDQCISKLASSWGLSPWLIDGHFLAVSSQQDSSVHTQTSSVLGVSIFSLFCPDWIKAHHNGLILIMSLKDLSPKLVLY